MKYAFILGHNPQLSVAEILAVLPVAKTIEQSNAFLIIELNDEIEAETLQKKLGGTVKIGKVISEKFTPEAIFEILKNNQQSNKLNFGVSYYDCPKDNLGMKVKGLLKQADISCRLVVSKDKALSAVVITKNHCFDFMVLANKFLAQTLAVQDFEDYGNRDYGRPVRDLVSGSLPPKLAKIMINLSSLAESKIILDPFCGSGTLIQEALLLGYSKIYGSDISDKAVKDTEVNLKWLKQHSGINLSGTNIFKCDVRELSKKVDQVDGIVTEPYLGPPLRGSEGILFLEKVIDDLSKLYLSALAEFAKVLPSKGVVVIVFPSFKIDREVIDLPIIDEIKKMGFTQVNDRPLLYGRPGQKVWRRILIFTRK
ncbi:MAG: DNA methyltransferase [Patescibacteria group bacterium]|nr:DNA methyltransferase [Patescibacteria group bacterium]